MSWITGLADKAENILNKLDQNAANALLTQDGGEFTTTTSLITATLQGVPNPLAVMKNNLSSNNLLLSPARREPSSMDKDGTNPTTVTRTMSPDKLKLYEVAPNSKEEAIAIDVDTENGVIMVIDSTAEKDGRTEDGSPQCEMARISPKRSNSDMEALVDRLTAERNFIECELLEERKTNSSLARIVSELEGNVTKLQQEYLGAMQQLQRQQQETAQQRQELQEYRVKAQKVFQMKDNLIAELKAPTSGVAAGTQPVGDKGRDLLEMELHALRQQQQHAIDESGVLLQQLEETRSDLKCLNKQHAECTRLLRTADDNVRLERERCLLLESEKETLAQELTHTRLQLGSQLEDARMLLEEKNDLIKRFRANNSGRSVSNDRESRIRALTDALVDKQNALEAITADRNALRIQLETLQDHRTQGAYEDSNTLKTTKRNLLLSNGNDDAKTQLPILMKENPFDNRVARRVKRAYSSLDSAGIRLGVFLRRYPLMRISVLMYVGLLHVWVMFVLFFSTP